MRMVDKRMVPISTAAAQRPIEFLTENGFSIIRLSEIDESIPASGATHEFLVRDPDGYELNITAQLSSKAIAEVGWRCRNRISKESSFWITLAERHLATYLWENGDYAPDARLAVDDLTLADLDLARRWDRET